MGEVNRVNISLVKSYKNDFKGEYDNFNNVTYNTFSSSYLKKCTDSCVSKLASELQTHYNKIKNGYKNVDKWWTDYNKNLENLENYLSGNGRLGSISEVSVRNYVVLNFNELKKYTVPFIDVFDSSVLTVENNNINVAFSSSGTSSSFDNNVVVGEATGFWDTVYDWWDDISNWWNNDAEPAIRSAYEVCCDVVSSVCATVGTGVLSLIEGIYRIGETIVDLVVLVCASVASVVTGLIDGGQAIYGAVTGNEWTSLTEIMLENTRAYVFKQHISGIYDSFYEDDLVGQWFVENAYGFETVRSIGSGIGCCAGVVILTIATLGVGGVVFGGGAASTAAMTAATSISSTVGFIDTITRMPEEEIRYNFNENFNKLLDGISDWWDDISYWWDNDAEPAIRSAYEVCCDVVSSVCATVGTGVLSLIEGILQFGEAIVDFVLLLDTAMKSVGTVVIDGFQAIYGAVTGNEWTSVTKKMWENTKGFVSEQYVTGWFDSFYEDTFVGQLISENAYGFETVRSIGSGIGYTAGVVILTIFTFGAGGAVAAGGSVTASTAAAATTASNMAMVAGAAGVGKGTQNAWAEGADIVEGLGTGFFTGLWEGIQYYLGGKIGKLDLFGAEKLFKISGTSEGTLKLLNGLGRVILDGVDGGLEGIVQPYINSIYKDSYFDESKNEYVKFDEDANFFDKYKELWNDNGGWGGVLTEAAVGSGSSLLGEAFDLRKYFKDSQSTSKISINEQELTDLKLEIQKEASSLDVLDPNFSRNADLLMKKAKLQEELVMFAHSQGMTFKEYIESCGKITQLDEATQTIVNQQARHIFEVAENAEPKISQMMRSLEVNGARLEGFNYRFKSEGSIARKIATKLNGSASVDAIGYYASNINDSLRYTLILDEKNYVNQMYDSLHKLINEGYQVRSINNSWGDSIYQGVNTSLVSPDGMVFELQFHTDASFKTKEFLNHQLYEIYRSPLADISQIKAAREIMEINQQMYVKTIDGMVNLTQFDIIDNATYKNYFGYNDFVSHYDSQIASWKANLSEKQKNLFHNYISEGVQKPGNYAAVNGLERNTLIDTTNRTVTVQNTFTSTRPAPISFEQFEQTYLPIEYEGRMITTMEDFIDMQHECFNELNAATSQMKLDEGTILYRGINLNAIESMTDVNGNSIGITNGDSLETIFNKIRAAGGEYTDKGFMSASPVPVYITTSKDIVLKLKCKKGVSGVDLSAVGGFENEFLLTANQKFDVVGFGKEEICGVMKHVLYLVSK